MGITYSWNFNPLESYPTASGQTDVVFKVHWQLTATTESYNSRTLGVQNVQYVSGSTFIPFNELTEEIVYGWVTSSMSEEEYNRAINYLNTDIENQINPPVLVQQSPWIVPPPDTPFNLPEPIIP